MKIQMLLLAMLPALAPVMAQAEVNMQDASFLHRQNDFSPKLLARTYNSRSLWSGVFGFGWCADFEKRVDLKTGKVWHCDRETASQARTKGKEWIEIHEKQNQEIYNFRGQLMQIKDGKGLWWDLSYDRQGRLSRIHSRKEDYSFVYEKFHLARIENRRGADSQPIRIVPYQWRENMLVQSGNEGAVSKYWYDELQNLTLIETWGSALRSPSAADSEETVAVKPSTGKQPAPKLKIQIEYQSELDQVRSVRIGNCQQDFSFQKISNQKFQSVATIRCPSHVPRQQIFTFTARPLKTGKWKISGENHEPILLP
jgi:YD repeat-containing protein